MLVEATTPQAIIRTKIRLGAVGCLAKKEISDLKKDHGSQYFDTQAWTNIFK